MASSPLDFAVLAVYLVGVVAFGLWIGREQKGAADYMVGDRNIPWWGLLFSIVATETSSVTFLSIPGFAWSRDFTFIQLPLGYAIGRLLVVAFFLPHYFAGEYFTAYEVLRKRFGGAVGQAASFLFIVTRSLADGLRLFLTAIVVQEMSGLSLPLSVGLVGVTTIVYTFVGGHEGRRLDRRHPVRGLRARGGRRLRPPRRAAARAAGASWWRSAPRRASSTGSISRPPSTAPTRCGPGSSAGCS